MIATRDAYGKVLAELGAQNERIVALSADLAKSTKVDDFAKKFPDRFFQTGVAEANMTDIAAGLAACGKIPFVSSFCVFSTGRAWEMVRNTIGYGRLNVKIVGTHGGISVGADGSSHQATEDIALMRVIPGMTVIVPADGPETERAIRAVAAMTGPVYVRLGRAKVPTVSRPEDGFTIGKGIALKNGKDLTIVACGALVSPALQAAETLAAEKISAAVVNLHTIKPIDTQLILKMAEETGAFVTAEEHQIMGGLGGAVCETLARVRPIPVEMVGIDDRFGQSGEPDELFREYGLEAKDIVAAAHRVLERKPR
ncbi:MAG: transketolase family protein [Planctomycetota bacterium]|nr:transketolase family protein [Planctomycetota bacterium]